MDNNERMPLQGEYLAGPEARPGERTTRQPNKGELNFPEQQPADPLASPEAMAISHRGGAASQRTELY